MNTPQKQTNPEVEALKLKLLDHSAYSSAWIDIAADISINCGVVIKQLSPFDVEQLQVIRSVFTSADNNPEIAVEKFLNPELNATQMQLLLNAYSHGLTTKQIQRYFDPNIPYVKINWAISALLEGVSIYQYVDQGYDKDQLYEIYAGIKSKVDYTSYAKIRISAEKMGVARHAMELGLKVTFGPKNVLTIE